MATEIKRTPTLSGSSAEAFLDAMDKPKTKATKKSIKKSYAKFQHILEKDNK